MHPLRVLLLALTDARKIQGELTKLGFVISLATASRYLPKHLPDPGRRQRWMTFFRNHKDAIAAMNFCIVPTVSFQLSFGTCGRRQRRTPSASLQGVDPTGDEF